MISQADQARGCVSDCLPEMNSVEDEVNMFMIEGVYPDFELTTILSGWWLEGERRAVH